MLRPAWRGILPVLLRVTSGATLLGGVADLVAAIGGIALMAGLARARTVTAAGIGLAGQP